MADKQTQNLDTATPTLDDVTVSFDYTSPTELKKTTWQLVRDLFKTYFDTIYQAVLVSGTNIKTVNSQSLLGSGDIVISGGSGTLAGLTDVDIVTPANGEIIAYNSTSTKWENVSLSGGGDMLASTYDPAGIAQQVAGLTATQTFSTGVKTFLTGMFGLRNVANTFTSFFTNTNTASRTYTLKDANGTLAFTTDITGTNSGTNTGDQTSIVGITGTKAQFDTAVTDGNIVYSGDSPTLATITTTGNIELGHATDTTISRVSAGVIAVEGVTVPTISSTSTLTNKNLISSTNVIEEITTTASSATPTPTGGSLRNFFTVTALAAGATFGAPSGTPVNGNTIIMRVKDNGTARTLAYNAIYRAIGITLPTTTVVNKTLYFGMKYNSTDSKWDILAYAIEA